MTAPQFLELAVSLSVQAALVIALTQGLCLVARRRVAVQCRLWTCCYVLQLLIVVAALLLPHWRPVRPWNELSTTTILGAASFETQMGRMAFLVWLIGAASSILLFAANWIVTVRLVGRCRPIATEQLRAWSDQPIQDPDGRTVSFVSGPDITGPCCWQFHQPHILLPASVLKLGRREQDFIIRHEVEHLRLRHPLQLFLQQVVRVVFWFHPMVWWASYQSALVREYACDEAALDARADIVDYLRTLLTVVEGSQGHGRRTPGTLGFSIGHGVIARRARRLVSLAQRDDLTLGRHARGWKPLGAAAVAATVLIAGTAWAPINVLASGRAGWSPWPRASAAILHDFGVVVRDYEVYDERTQVHELLEDGRERAEIPAGERTAGP